jgi:glucokinase
MKRLRNRSRPDPHRRRARPGTGSEILAGDVGGTKTTLGIFRLTPRGGLEPIREGTFPSRDHPGLEPILTKFLGSEAYGFAAAAFAIAGPVLDNRVQTTNLPWQIDARSLARSVGCREIRLLNDLEGTAIGAMHLPSSEIQVLQQGVERNGNRAVIAAGTGLGQAILFWDGRRHVAVATEGGHTEFGPRDAQQEALLEFVKKTHRDHISYERLVSGPGLVNIFNFLDQVIGLPVEVEIRTLMQSADSAAVIGEAAIAGTSRICREAVEVFSSIYGAQAGNLALTVMATGGVYLGGGIVTKLLPRLESEDFSPPSGPKVGMPL